MEKREKKQKNKELKHTVYMYQLCQDCNHHVLQIHHVLQKQGLKKMNGHKDITVGLFINELNWKQSTQWDTWKISK